MKEWICSLRLSICLFPGVLVLVSFKIANLSMKHSWLCAITVVAIACATMVQNDWRDRFQDIKRRKYLAFNNPRKFFIFTVALWIITFILSAMLTAKNNNLGLLSCLMIAAGLIYSETRKIPMAPIILVCLTWASLVLFPIFLGNGSFQIWLLFIFVFITVFGREIITDLKDVSVDINYKWTLPLKLGIKQSEIIAGISIFAGMMTMGILSAKTLLDLPFMAMAMFFLLNRKDYKTSKYFLDIGIAIAVLMLFC